MQTFSEWTPSQVWTHTEGESKFSQINAPTAGARTEVELPKGKHEIQIHSLATPNGVKVNLFLEEICELDPTFEYDAFLVHIMKQDQFTSGFVGINPNSKIPAMLDYATTPPTRVFESGAILMYLAERFGKFMPTDPRMRTECMCWLFWQMGSGPYVGGGFGHFYNYAPFKIEYAVNRFAMETKRQLDVLDKQLEGKSYVCGEEYTIADMAIWPWYGALVLGRLYNAAEYLQVDSYTNVVRWAKAIDARPAAVRSLKVNKAWGEPWEMLPERHSRADFDALPKESEKTEENPTP